MRAVNELIAIDVDVAAEFFHPLVGLVEHCIFGPNLQGASGAGKHAGRWLIALETGITEITFVDFIGCGIEFRYTEGTGIYTGFTPYALVDIEADVAEFGVIQGLGRANLRTACIGAVHAAVFPKQPLDAAALINMFLETDERPGVPLKIRGVLITAGILGS